MSILIAVLAAGASARMRGGDKLIQDIGNGTPLLSHCVQTALDTGQDVIVMHNEAPARMAVLDALSHDNLLLIPSENPKEGIAASIRGAVNHVRANPEISGLMFLLADMPDVTLTDLNMMCDEFSTTPDHPLRATNKAGKPGHPVIFPSRLFARLSRLAGDTGARDVLRDAPPRLIALPDGHATMDLDTPEDWDKWRNR